MLIHLLFLGLILLSPSFHTNYKYCIFKLMSHKLPLILFFKDISKGDVGSVGGKGANLGEMTQAKFPVPPGFAITVSAYDLFLEENDLKQGIDAILRETDVNDTENLRKATRLIQQRIVKAPIPKEVILEVEKAYRKISGILSTINVAVRSSATAEDLPGMSFAGQQATYLNVKGATTLLMKVRECWASLFTERAIFYRVQQKISHEKVKISVIVQKMVQSEVSGVMFTINPVTNDKEQIIIEAVWGLGEMMVQGSVVPDHYVVQKDTFSILSKEVSDQSIQLTKKGGVTEEIAVPVKQRDTQKLSNDEITVLAKIGQRLQEHYYFPQDVEWARDNGKIYIVQTRPVTTMGSKDGGVVGKTTKKLGNEDISTLTTPILMGSAASPGIGTGRVRIVHSPAQIGKVGHGDILVAKMTSPDYVPAMKKAAGIVTDEGGQTSHAAIVSRELGVPCVVGTKNATALLKEDQIITVDGKKGQIFMGSAVKVTKEDKASEKAMDEKSAHLKTATKIYVNLAEPELASKVSDMNVDGVGLLRAEFMIANIGIHPKEAIKNKTQDEFVRKLASNMKTFAKNFYPRPVVYRATDFKTNEYRSLQGGKAWEPEEPNPLMGFRGAFRYIKQPEVFNLELTALRKVREEYDNLHLMIPFVRSPQELARVRRLVATEGLFESASFKFWMMVELPINVIMIDEFLDVGIDGVSVGSNDLTMLLMGTDRDNAEVAESYNERSKAVLWALKRVIKHCQARNVTVSICGQAASSYDDLVKKLVSFGITSLSVNPDAVSRVRGIVHQAEKEI